ncbi:type VI secretion system baseplate subunit TssG [Burkholderia sp.]|jgi:type VI secretion system protein ImpH|uniref:type VI secretion system baseplate subunit TssG n=1 Tax=Burkholderia sp. TaxID=36773 RepID=UPI0035E31581
MNLHDLSNLDPLVAALLARAPQMNFMQLCRLLEERMPDRLGFARLDTLEQEPVRFRPRPRVGFPAGEIASVEFDDERRDVPPTVRTTFMGLYGVDAAMPSHLIDDIVLREEGHEAVEAFLDQFNHRFVTLLYRTWKKYRYPESFRSGGSDGHSHNLLNLAGFGWGDKPRRASLPDSRMLALVGLLVQKTRTPEGLTGVIALAAPGAEVRISEFWSITAQVARHQPLTSASEDAIDVAGRRGLGGGYVLGRRIAYRSRAVCATLCPASAQQAQDLLPGAPFHRELMALVYLYVGTKVDVHLRMEVSSRLAPRPTIGAADISVAPRLGWTTVLPTAQERTISIGLGIYEATPAPAANAYVNLQQA